MLLYCSLNTLWTFSAFSHLVVNFHGWFLRLLRPQSATFVSSRVGTTTDGFRLNRPVLQHGLSRLICSLASGVRVHRCSWIVQTSKHFFFIAKSKCLHLDGMGLLELRLGVQRNTKLQIGLSSSFDFWSNLLICDCHLRPRNFPIRWSHLRPSLGTLLLSRLVLTLLS